MTNVYFLGPEKSFSEIITKKVLDSNLYIFTPCKSFIEIGEKVLEDKGSVGVLPIENSITSDIHENIDFLFKNNLNIVKEAYLNINLHLIGLKASKLENIKTVLSHPRAILQCTNFIKKHNFQLVETLSTAGAKNILEKNKNQSQALIGSKELVKNEDQFIILKENIGNIKFNRTRFAFVSSKDKENMGNKASIAFKVLHKPGSLAKIFSVIAEKNLNVDKIESRPIPGTNWEYYFWVDIESHENLKIAKIDEIFKQNTLEYIILGVYKRGEVFES